MDKQIWVNGIPEEVKFWRDWVSKRKVIEKQVSELIDSEDLVKLILDAKEPVKILDMGCGVTSFLAYADLKKKVEITAMDALADSYNNLIDEYGLKVNIRPVKGEVERLNEYYKSGTFDLVYMQNALDHCYDPFKGISQLLRVTKTGGYMYLKHYRNVAKCGQYKGLHQWNFDIVNGKFCIDQKPIEFDSSSVEVKTVANFVVLIVKK